ncbi:MAG TPA: Ig-like domain-containing protein [Vicinamibacteria bacterium]|nr:Ig-like domain-containing protein [Vicinamibacteria bacterium]
MSSAPSTAARPTLRTHGAAMPAGGPPLVSRLDPPNGATGVFRDALVVASLTHPADPSTLSSCTFRVEEDASVVPARLMLSPDGRAVIWRGRRLLTPNREHRVVISGLRDVHGREVAGHTGWFTPCDLFWIDPSG